MGAKPGVATPGLGGPCTTTGGRGGGRCGRESRDRHPERRLQQAVLLLDEQMNRLMRMILAFEELPVQRRGLFLHALQGRQALAGQFQRPRQGRGIDRRDSGRRGLCFIGIGVGIERIGTGSGTRGGRGSFGRV